MFWWAEDAWQRDTSLHHGRCLIPKVTFGVGWGRQELRAWLAVSMGGIKQDLCPVSPPAVCPSHRCIMGWHKEGPACCLSSCEPKRHTQHQTCLWLWDEEASHLLGKGRACWQCFGNCWRWSRALLWAGVRDGSKGNARLQDQLCRACGTLERILFGECTSLPLNTSLPLIPGGFNLYFLSHAFPRTANRPVCGASCTELCFPFSSHACWANSNTRECVLALGVWGMYLLFHCLTAGILIFGSIY